jgi:hypothetical protein
MKKDVFLWNKGYNASVRASKIREITIFETPYSSTEQPQWFVEGWFNKNEAFKFGYFDSLAEAQAFVEKLHKEMDSE